MTKENKLILYHYTTMNTFYNMMEHSLCYEEGDIHPKHITMWATHYAYQNDPSECQLFFEGLKKNIADYIIKNHIVLNNKDKESIQNLCYSLNIFTISFSKQEDDLTMWRGYGQNGDGITLGFDFSKLPLTLPMYGADYKERKSWSESEPTYLLQKEIKKCEYVDSNNIKIAEEACDRTLKNIFNKDDEWKDVKQAIINNEFAPIYKHKKYEVEGEYRIVKHQIMPQYRLADNKLIPYIKVNVPIECLNRIIIGPCQSSSEVVMRTKSFLLTKGIDVEVTSSIIPYRSKL